MRGPLKINNKSWTVRGLFGVLILLYLAGSLQLDSIHRLIHAHDESISHSVEIEQNACHRTVFHQATQNTCDHPTHLSELKKCPWCFGSVHYETILSAQDYKNDFNLSAPVYTEIQDRKELKSANPHDSRGPPSKVI